MEKQLRKDCRSFDVTNGITIEEFNDKYKKILKQIKDRYGYITNIKIHAECGTYNDGEDYFEEIHINYSRYETDEEFERRINLTEMRKTEQKEREVKLLKQYIESNKDEVVKYMKELNLI